MYPPHVAFVGASASVMEVEGSTAVGVQAEAHDGMAVADRACS
jgi:hypothetical protein